jgi:hypothetical protein
MMERSTWGAMLAVLVLVVATGACSARDATIERCRDVSRPSFQVPPDPTVPWPAPSLFLANGTTIEASGRRWVHDQPSGTGHRVGVKIHRPDVPNSQRVDLCFVGGESYTTLHAEDTPWDTWHDTYAFVQENPGATVVGLRLFNTGDGITFTHRAHDWRVVGVRADGNGMFAGAYIHDDCVENDSMFAGYIVDSKFDGCHTFLSANAGEILPNPPDGSDRLVILSHVLVRLQGYEQSFDVEKYGTGHHGGFFKFSTMPSMGIPPKLVVRDSVFRSDTPAPYGGNANGNLGLPPGTDCSDVVLIGTERWPANELRSWTDQCTNLRLEDAAEWDRLVAEWDEAHPPLG